MNQPKKIAFNIKGIDITEHSFVKFVERFHPGDFQKFRNEMVQALGSGIAVHPRNEAVKLMNNGYKSRKYLKSGRKIAVVSQDKTVVTFLDYAEEKKNWKEK